MRKILSIFLTACILFSLFCITVSAKTPECKVIVSESVEYFADGSSITTTITQNISDISTLATTKTVSGSKIKTIKNSNGDILFKFKIDATFSVTVGTSATCTSVSCSASDCTNGWELDSYTTSKSGNTASATGVFKKKTLFITTQTQEIPISLSCDVNGVLS